MLKIGEFSKLSHLTVKALRFYEKEGILTPARTDEWTGYRYYGTEQLTRAAAVKSYRQLGLSIEEIKAVFSGAEPRLVLSAKAAELKAERNSIDVRLSMINSVLEDNEMKYSVTKKTVPETIVYSAETVLKQHSDIMEWIPSVGSECAALNPSLKCAEPGYEFCEYPDEEYRETDIRVRHNEAVTETGKGNETIYFRVIPATDVLSVYHKGPYETIGEAYAYLMKYAKANGFRVAGLARECYIDGIWNKESPDEWLTEIQLPVG